MIATAIGKCPRCGAMHREDHPALSRADHHTDVCAKCGSEEAAGQLDGDFSARASLRVAPRGVRPEWVEYCATLLVAE